MCILDREPEVISTTDQLARRSLRSKDNFDTICAAQGGTQSSELSVALQG